MEEAIAKLSPADQALIRKNLEEEKSFFNSIKNLPEAERLLKTQEHIAANPPPIIPGGMGGGPPPPGPGLSSREGSPGGVAPPDGVGSETGNPDGPAGGHIPPPSVRYGMDKNIVQSVHTEAAQ